MKNGLFVALIVFFAFFCYLQLCNRTNKNPETLEAEVIDPEPLVIESTRWTPHGVFNGTIVISGDGIDETGYEGIMYIEMDGGKIRISCTEAVRSRYVELF